MVMLIAKEAHIYIVMYFSAVFKVLIDTTNIPMDSAADKPKFISVSHILTNFHAKLCKYCLVFVPRGRPVPLR